MKITAITPFLFEMPLSVGIADARNTILKRSALLVRVDTDAGIAGWGECASFAGCGRLVAQVVSFFAERLVGRDPTMIAAIYDESYHATQHFGRRGLVLNALSGIDVALWDILGKAAGQPLYKLLGACRDSIQFYFNGGYYVDGDSMDFLRRSAEKAVERGGPALKIKIGRFGVDDDVKRIETARAILGPDRDLMVDANGVLDLRYLRRLDPAMVANDVRWMEEPVSIRAVPALAELRDRLQTPIAGYELEMTLTGWTDLIAGRTVDIAQPDSIWSGGITECRRIAAVAQAHEVEFVPHNFASIVCLAANAHLAASAKTGGWLEVDSNENPFLWSLDRNQSFQLCDGRIPLPDLPGLGIDPDLERLAAYSVAL